ncbi:MAG: hypothetical protein RLO49_08125 [Rhodospirillales bacterium]
MEKVSGVTKSLFEVVVTVCFTFIPFFFLSIKWLEVEGENTQQTLTDAFLGYWQAGEIVLPILGLCGAVAALLALNVGYFAWWAHAVVGAILLVFTFGGGAALTGTGGFNQPLNPELITVGFAGYATLALLWFVLAAIVRTTEPHTRASDQVARTILEQANEHRGKSGDKS